MRKFIFAFMMLLLAGCAGGKAAYQAQATSAKASVDAVQESLNALAADVGSACGDIFKARFDAMESALAALRVQISSITLAADADMKNLRAEITKRNTSIIGLVLLLLATLWYGLRKQKI